MPDTPIPERSRCTRANWLVAFTAVLLVSLTVAVLLARQPPDALLGGACALVAAVAATLLTAARRPV